jgi:allophanate hydrolase subunit 1
MSKLTKEELKGIQDLITEFNTVKIKLGDTVIAQNALLKDVENLKIKYAENEAKLVVKYGADSVIDVSTGEITKKE